MEEDQVRRGPGRPRKEVSSPKKIALIAPHGFIDAEGSHRYWFTNQEVTDPDEIVLLIEREARYVVKD